VSVHIVCDYLIVLFNHLGEIRDRSFEQQRYQASGLNLVTAAVVL
jgi:TnpA family transposase